MKHVRDRYAADGAGERLDCTVRAYAVAACVSYESARALFESYGRKKRHKTYPPTMYKVMLKTFPGVRKQLSSRMTLKTFSEKHPSGHFIIHTRGHALALTDGVIHDWQPAPRRIVKSYWQLC